MIEYWAHALTRLSFTMYTTRLLVGLAGLALSIAAPTPGDANALDLGKVKVCDGLRQQGTCKDINANMACVALESPIKYNLNSIVQDKGNMCAYYQGGSCQNFAFLVDSSHDTQTADVSPKWARVLTHVRCIPGSAGLKLASAAASLGANVEHLDPVLKSDSSTPDIVVRQSPVGDALICSPDIHPGPCFKVPASGTCTDLPANVDRRVRTIYQNAGSHCEYFKSDDCHGRLGSSHAKQSMRVTVPEAIGNAMGSAYCQLSPSAAEGAAVEETGWKMGEFVAEEVA